MDVEIKKQSKIIICFDDFFIMGVICVEAFQPQTTPLLA